MKENGINKLTVLLDEYKEENNMLNTDMNGQLEIGNYIYVNYPCAEKLCGKRFGFIQRLIKKGKIKDEEWQYMGTDDMQYYYSKIDILLMLLSISDSPIEFLISILK